MAIQWYPGHMAKAVRMTEDSLKVVDAVIYVLDARVPFSCINPYFNQLIGTKPILYVLNKSDLADPQQLRAWERHLTEENTRAVAICGTKSGGAKAIIPKLKELVAARITKWANKGLKYTPKAMVAGIPNTGKSTIINTLAGGGRTVTGDRPGVTRGKQWVKVGGTVELLDMPGVLPPKFEDQNIARHLAYVGSVKQEIVDILDLSLNMIVEFRQMFPQALIDRYKINTDGLPEEVLERIGKARGLLLKGGVVDTERTCTMLLDDFRKGRLGRLTLESPGVDFAEL